MATQTQPVPAKSAKTQLAAPSAAEQAADHARKVEAFLNSCREMSAQAQRNGLTEEILASILAEK